ncbi:hypothetical protein [Oscillatoria sp. FACHB-1407]|nr:hypothetical protein [Oscillatoria sp. FACHB-1407]
MNSRLSYLSNVATAIQERSPSVFPIPHSRLPIHPCLTRSFR